MAITKKYPVEIIEMTPLGNHVYSMLFKSLKKPFKFKPGQFLHLAIDEFDFGEQWPESRCFSIQSPSDKDTLKITFAVKGTFTKRMAKELMVGNNITLKLPYGDLFLQEHSKDNTIFIAGGTGITPFLSLFNHESFKNYNNPMLFLGLKEYSMNFYSEELEIAENLNPTFKLNIFHENNEGLINLSDVLIKDIDNNTFFISGPPSMIKFFKTELIKNNIIPERIKTDDWE